MVTCYIMNLTSDDISFILGNISRTLVMVGFVLLITDLLYCRVSLKNLLIWASFSLLGGWYFIHSTLNTKQNISQKHELETSTLHRSSGLQISHPTYIKWRTPNSNRRVLLRWSWTQGKLYECSQLKITNDLYALWAQMPLNFQCTYYRAGILGWAYPGRITTNYKASELHFTQDDQKCFK